MRTQAERSSIESWLAVSRGNVRPVARAGKAGQTFRGGLRTDLPHHESMYGFGVDSARLVCPQPTIKAA